MKPIIAGYLLQEGNVWFTEEDAKKLTHLCLAFGLLQQDQTIKTEHLEILKRIPELRKANPKLKILLSLNSGHPDAFSIGASTELGRKKIAAACAKIIQQYDLDGIDVDWEYPCCPSNGITASPEDYQNFTLLLEIIRTSIDEIREDALLTVAAGGGEYYLHFTDMEKTHPYLDYIFLMTYDLKCGFHALSGHHTNLYPTTGDYFSNSCADVVELFNKAGVPIEKLVIGAAFYSRQWKELPDRNQGLLLLSKSGGGYGPTYTELKQNYINKNGYTRYWDDQAKAPWLFNGTTFISYDDPQSIEEKCLYIKKIGCAGIFYWQHTYDEERELLNVMVENLV